MTDPKYPHGHGNAVLRSHRSRTVADSAEYLSPYLAPGKQLLDVGCGPGSITVDFGSRLLPARVTAIDAASDAISIAEAAAAEAGVSNIDFSVADVFNLPFENNSFDIVHAHQVLQYLPDPVAALIEMRRVLKPGGVLAARDADYAAMVWYPPIPELDEWQSLYRDVAIALGGQPDAGRRLLSWAREAGFTNIEASASVWSYANEQQRQWWGGMWADRILTSGLAEQAVSGGYATRSDLERISQGWGKWTAAHDGWFAVLHGEVICHND